MPDKESRQFVLLPGQKQMQARKRAEGEHGVRVHSPYRKLPLHHDRDDIAQEHPQEHQIGRQDHISQYLSEAGKLFFRRILIRQKREQQERRG